MNKERKETAISLVTPLENIAVPEGADATFTCSFDHCPATAFIYWSKDGQRFSTVSNTKYVSTLENGLATLRISAVAVEDGGLYKCEVEENENKSWSEAVLDVIKQTNKLKSEPITIGEDAPSDSKQTSSDTKKPKKVIKKKPKAEKSSSVSKDPAENEASEQQAMTTEGESSDNAEVAKPKKTTKTKAEKPVEKLSTDSEGTSDKEANKTAESKNETQKTKESAKPEATKPKEPITEERPSSRTQKREAKIIKELVNTQANVEDSIVLSVTTTPEEWTAVKWLHDGVGMKTTGKYQLQEEKDALTLRIKNCTKEDGGEWRLIAKTSTSSLETSCFVDVHEEENTVPEFTTFLEDNTCSSGCMMMLKTTIKGKPTPKVTWYKDGQKLKNSGDYRIVDNINSHMLTILETTTTNSGEYECVAKNINGTTTTKGRLTVTEKQLSSEKDDDNQAPIVRLPLLAVRELPEASEINLVCTVTGIPPPKIEWFKDDELVTFANFKYDNGIATLNIPEAKLIHSGIYTCLAKNRFGTVRSSGVLYIQPKPSDAQKAPRFEELLCNSTVENGRELSLVCKAVGKPQPSITWLKDGLKIIPNQRLIQYTDRRGVVRLNIINCKAEDAGEYSCEAENGFGRDFTHCTVKVVDDKEKAMNEKKMDKSPQITRNLVDGNVHEGNKFVFECELEADDSPVVKWYHNKTLIEDEKTLRTYFDGRLAILKVFEASSSHAGVYECVASNAFGEVFSSASLLVEKSEESEEYPPNMPEFTTKIRDLTVKEGEDASFTCTVKGALNPSIQWLFNGSALVNSTQTIIQSNDNTHMLAIRNVLTANAGVYTAIAKNIYGDIHCSAELTVEKDESQPLITPIFRYPLHDKTAIVEESVSLKCSVDAAPPPSIIWEKDGKVVQPSNRLRFAQANNVYALKLHDVDMNDAGNYLVRITNPLGSITSECVLMIATESGADSHLVAAESDINRPEFLVKPPEENSVSEGSPLELRVKVKGYPTPNVKWLKDGKEIARTNRSYHTRVTGDGQYVLLIECAILKTSGTFTCVASNKHGHSECHTQLKVKKRASFKSTGESLPPIFASKPSNLTVTAGSPASFKCQVTGNPVPTISWLFVDTNNNKHLLEFEQSGWKLRNNGGVYKIVTDTAVKFQEGTYECTARNNEGTAMCSATLVVNDSEVSMGPPRILEPMNNAAAALNEECSFQVKAAGTPTAVEWFHNDKRVSEDHRIKLRQSKANCYELHITSIKLSDVGSYVLKLSNNDGETSSEAILNVKPSTLPLNPHPKQLKSPIVSPLSPLFQLMPETETVEPKISLKRKGAAPDFVVGLQDIEVAAGDVAAVAGKLQPKKRKHRLFEKHNQEDPKTLAGSLVARLSNENDEQMDYSPQQPRPNTTLAEIGKTIAKRNKEPCAPKFFVKPKPKTEIEEGKSLRLKAAVSGNPIPDVRWDKNGVILETGNKFSIYNDGDLYFLEVHHLSTFDQGFYNCTATNIDGFATCTTHVLVSTSDTLIDKLKKNMKKQQTPLEFLEVLPGREKVNVGQTLSLECIVTGYPAPDILWQRNGTTLVPQTNKYQMFFDGECSTLRFMSLSAADEGTIVCVAENPLGKVMTQTYLEVVSSNTGSANTPQFKKEHVKKQKTVDGKALVIEAPLKNSSEKVEFKWMSGNITIEDSEAFKYGRRKNNLTLTITDPFPEDSGEYVCVAQNRHGESQFTAEVTITDDMKSISHVKKPILKPKQPTIYGSEGCSVDLTAEASGSDPVISWFQEQEQILADEKHEMINSSNEHTLRIHDFEKSDQGGYKLLAINNAGIAEATFDLQLQSNTKLRNGTKPSFVQFPKNVQSKPNETVTVTCEFEGDPVPKVSWFKGSRQLESNENIVIETTPTSSQLSISMVDADLQGEYLCTIRNPFGEELNSLTILMLHRYAVCNYHLDQIDC